VSLETPKEKVQREREKQQAIAALPLLQDYAITFGSEHGLRVLAHILKLCHVGTNLFTNSGHTAFNLGEHSIALKIRDCAARQYKLAHDMIMDEMIDEQDRMIARLLDDNLDK
jgi:hypothetical protein